ncbi:hypothetical protein LPU83_pLPU83c_0478 (plasmid) [Rhizobium favelukesii]|uniref:Uncharacterized protein n=1 Tax=Rhizobium favelukesii TaxID=348824 RepID=W6RLB9_9HYPH|nr:hypothetical protein LPU83_pLPU83c_0478 [Rhizobium favelukesii]
MCRYPEFFQGLRKLQISSAQIQFNGRALSLETLQHVEVFATEISL